MKNSCSAYLAFRCFIGLLDIGSDILLCVHLILEDHLFWGIAVAGWVVLAILMSILAVIVERCRRGVPMSPCKYILMSSKIHAEIGEAFFESGPQLVTQLMILWSGIHQHDFEVIRLRKRKTNLNTLLVFRRTLALHHWTGHGHG